MGMFVSRLLSSDVAQLEAMMSALASALRTGEIGALLADDGFWAIVNNVASNPATLSELRGYVSGLLEEDWRTSSLLLDMLSPGMSSTQRRFVVSLVKLECVSRALRSDILWALMLDRLWVTALWKFASGRACSAEEEARLSINTREAAARSGWKKTNGRKANGEAAAAKSAAAAAQTEAAVSATAAAAAAPAAASAPSDSPLNPTAAYVPPPRAARFFTILTLPTIRALLEDISRSPDAPPIMPPPPPPPPTPPAATARGKSSKPSEVAAVPAPSSPAASSIPHAISAGLVSLLAPSSASASASVYKSNLILLLYRDLLKLEHIFEREKAALLPQMGGDPVFTGLGMERSTYIVVRALIKFCLCGSGRKGHGHEHPGAANAATTAPHTETHLPPTSVHAHAHPHPHPAQSQHTHGLSLVARLLLDPDFQSTFLTHDFLSTTFQAKLQYFIDAWPEDVYQPPPPPPPPAPAAATASDTAAAAGAPRIHHPPPHPGPPSSSESLDLALSLSLRSYADFFLQLCSDTHVLAFAAFLRGYDELFLEHLFATLYCDLILPLMRPEQYIRNMLAAPTAANEGGAATANGHGSGAAGGHKKRRGGQHQQIRFNPQNLLLFPPVLPADPNLPVLPPPAPIYVPLALLLSVGFMYHWLFEPVPTSILAQSKAQVDALRSKAHATSTQHQQQQPHPSKPHSIERLRDLLLRMDVYAQWAQAAANPPDSPVGSAVDPHVPRFSRSIRAVVTSAPSLLLLEFLQLHTPHIASCLSKTLDEIHMITTPPPSSVSPLARAVAMQGSRQPFSSQQMQQQQQPQTTPAAPPRDMFSPELSFHGGGTQSAPARVPVPVVPASTADPLLEGDVPRVLPVPSSLAPVTSPAIRAVQLLHSQPAPPPAQKGWLASMAGWVWSSPSPQPPPSTVAPSMPPQKSAAIAASELQPAVAQPPMLLAAPQTLLPLLAPRRSRFDHYMQNQLRLWCNRVLEGRGFTQLFAAQQKAGGGPMGAQQVPSTIFVLQAHAHAHGSAATSASGSGGSSNGGGIFPPISPSVPSSSSAEAFYIELLAFDPQFVCELASLLYTYLWMDARDEHRIRERKLLKLKAAQASGGGTEIMALALAAPHAEVLPVGPIKPACSSLFPLVQRNMLRPASTPIDLGPIRPQEYLALICKQVGALWSDDHVAVFLGRSENFWKMMLDTTWWEIISNGSGDDAPQQQGSNQKQQRQSPSDELHPLLSHPRVPVVSATRRSALHSLLSLISNKSSPYFSVLLELGHHSQFPGIFSEANVGSVLALLRLVCSWQVHAILSRFESLARDSSPTAMAHLLPGGSSQDFYATLTAPFTFWGIVHSLSVVPLLRQQYLGALHWFLSKRNMDMQIEIWGVVKEVLYGETAPATSGGSEENSSSGGAGTEGDDKTQVPAPAPLHLLSSAAAVANSPLLQQKLRLRRLRSLSQIAKSVHNSGILQAVFTFPLATAHFYSVWVAEMLWPTRSLSVDAYFPPATTAPSAAAEPVTTESVTSLLLSQLGSLLYTSARAASAQGFLQIPTIRSAFLEGIALALEETHAFGSGAAQAAAKQAQLERAQARRIREETKEAIRAQNEQRIREATAAKQAAIEQANAAKGQKQQAKSKKKTKPAAPNALPPLVPPPPASTAAPSSSSSSAAAAQSSRKELRPAFNPEHSYRLPINSSVPPTADIPSLTSRGLSLSAVPFSAATAEAERAVARAQSEVQKLMPSSAVAAAPASAPTLSLNMLPDVIPARRKAEDDTTDVGAATPTASSPAAVAAAGASAGTAASALSSTDEAVSLPPPFSFEPVSVVDEDDEERSGGGGRAAPASAASVPQSDLSAAAAANAAAVAAALANPRGSLHADSALDLPEQSRRSSASAAAASASLPSIPSLPQKHRLLYSFFQLVLAQPIFKLILTSPALWEMLSDIGFLELLTVLMFGAIEEGSGTTAAKRSGATDSSAASSARQSNGGGGGAFQAARATIAHTREVLASKRASLHAWQRLVAHWRFSLFMDEMRSKRFETSLAAAMAEILRFLNGDKGKALILAVMDGLEQREQQAGASPTGKHGRHSLSSRFHSLTSLLSHRSTTSLLTSPRFWALFADGTTLRYFSQGSYLKLWWYNSVRMGAGAGADGPTGAAGVVGLAQPVWRLVKEGGAKAATSVRSHTALRLEQSAQKLAGHGGASSSNGTGSGQPSSAGAASSSKRDQLKGFVRQKLSATAAKLAQTAQPHPAPSRHPPPSVTSETASSGAEDSSAGSSSPQPAGLASLQHFFTLMSTVHSLLFARHTRHDTIRAAL